MEFSEIEIEEGELRHRDTIKWGFFGAGVLPLWVADMDFRIAPSIRKALEKRLAGTVGYENVFGDTGLMELLRGKVEGMGMRGLPKAGWVFFLTGVVAGIYGGVVGLSEVGDEVMTMVPVYPPFLMAVEDHGRVLKGVAMKEPGEGGKWEIDWEGMEAAVGVKTKLLLLCHPHNPCGRVWGREELLRISDFAERHALYVVSDELHADLVLEEGCEFLPFVSVASEVVKMRTVTLMGPCKTYNTAGIGIGAMVSHNPELLARVKKVGAGLMGHSGTLNVSMWRAALEDDGEWLRTVKKYLRGNLDFLEGFVRERLSGVKMARPEATYLAWLDYRGHKREGEIFEWLLKEGKVGLSKGADFGGKEFGERYRGFVRLNFATSRKILGEALERMARVHEG